MTFDIAMKSKTKLIDKILYFLFFVAIVLSIINYISISNLKSDLKENADKNIKTIESQQSDINALNQRIKPLEISKPNVTAQQANAPYSRDIPLSDELQQYTYEIATEYGVNYDLMLAIMQTESQFQNVISDNGEDIGLCQINVVNAEWLYQEHGINNLMDERQNIEACAIILNKLSGQFDDETHVVMAYNLGAGKAQKYISSGKTTEYTEKVYKNLNDIKE